MTNVTVQIVFHLLGGLALFLFGMTLLSEGLKKVAGHRLKSALHTATKNPFLGLLIGLGVTALIQSSSATTVMSIGLVNAGLLTLKQAIGVILGANIGTTLTAWLISLLAVFKITLYTLPAVAIGFAFYVAAKKRNLKLWGQVILGLGILFLGLGLMKTGVEPLKGSAALEQFFQSFAQNPLLGVLAGMLVTMIFQSSSATIAMVQIMAWQGLIGFEAAIPLILGDNIGTTVTAQIAAFKTNLSARRTARAHALFNILGVAYMLPLVYLGIFPKIIQGLVPGAITTGNIMVHIALAHSIFNIFNGVFVFLPCIGLLEKISIKLVPGRPERTENQTHILARNLLAHPDLAIKQTKQALIQIAYLAEENLEHAWDGFFNKNYQALAKVPPKEDSIDNAENEIIQYLIELSQTPVSPLEAKKITYLLHSANDLERIGDHAQNLAQIAQERIEQKIKFSSQAKNELKKMYGEARGMMDEVIEALEKNAPDLARTAFRREKALNHFQIQLREAHLNRLQQGICQPRAGIIFLDTVANLERIGDHLTNILQAIIRGDI